MALTATYDSILSRVQLAASVLGASATYAVFERTIDGVQYVTVRGGSARTVTSEAASLDDYEFVPGVLNTYRVTSYNASDVQQAQFTATITQDIDDAWLKVPASPFLNRPVTVSMRTEVARRARGGVFDVVGRTMPVLVGDVRGSREFTLQIRTETSSDERNLDYLFASGEVLFLQCPLAMDQFPSGYFTAGDITRAPEERYTERRIWNVPLVEVAAPGADVIGSAYTCAGVLADYATVTDMLADNATIADLLQRVGSPEDVIVA